MTDTIERARAMAKKSTESLEAAILHSDVGEAHKFTEHEVNQLAASVRFFLSSKSESVEGLFDPDSEDGSPEVVVLNQI